MQVEVNYEATEARLKPEAPHVTMKDVCKDMMLPKHIGFTSQYFIPYDPPEDLEPGAGFVEINEFDQHSITIRDSFYLSKEDRNGVSKKRKQPSNEEAVLLFRNGSTKSQEELSFELVPVYRPGNQRRLPSFQDLKRMNKLYASTDDEPSEPPMAKLATVDRYSADSGEATDVDESQSDGSISQGGSSGSHNSREGLLGGNKGKGKEVEKFNHGFHTCAQIIAGSSFAAY